MWYRAFQSPGYDAGDHQLDYGSTFLEQHRDLAGFLASVEKRAFRMTEIALGNRDDALDVLQDAMCSLVERYGQRNPEEWGPLFSTILHNRIQDWRRREAVRMRFRAWLAPAGGDEPDLVQQVADERQPGPEQGLRNSRSMEALGKALRKLPARQQQAFMLRVFEGLDVEGTAVIMQCSSGSVKTHFSRAVQALRRELEDY